MLYVRAIMLAVFSLLLVAVASAQTTAPCTLPSQCIYLPFVAHNASATAVDLKGEVLVRPRSSTAITTTGPIDYVFLLDRSASIRWRWDSDIDGSTVITAADAARYVVVREALKHFIDTQLGPDDRMAILGFTGPSNRTAIYAADRQFSAAEVDSGVTISAGVLASFTRGDDAGKASLKGNLDSYRPGDSTSTAPGVELARRTLLKADNSRLTTDGISSTVALRLVLITDGPANTYIDSIFRLCNDGSRQSEQCIGELAGPGQPIDQMTTRAQQIKSQYGKRLASYVVAIGPPFDKTGLNYVASQSSAPWFNTADSSSKLQPVLTIIGTRSTGTACTPVEELAQPPIDPARLDDGGQIGMITLFKDGIALMTTSIISEGGKASYSFPKIAPGSYTLKGYVKYKGQDDILRLYSLVSAGGQHWGSSAAFQVVAPPDGGTLISAPTLTFDLAAAGVCSVP